MVVAATKICPLQQGRAQCKLTGLKDLEAFWAEGIKPRAIAVYPCASSCGVAIGRSQVIIARNAGHWREHHGKMIF